LFHLDRSWGAWAALGLAPPVLAAPAVLAALAALAEALQASVSESASLGRGNSKSEADSTRGVVRCLNSSEEMATGKANPTAMLASG